MKNSSGIIIAVLVGIILMIVICCCGLSVMTFSSEDFQEGFWEGYCESLEEQGQPIEDDPNCQEYIQKNN